MAMKSYRVALIPRWQSLYRGYKKPIGHFLCVLLGSVGARIQRVEKTGSYVYIRLLLPEKVNVQRAIAWVKRESAAALAARLKKDGLMYGGKPNFWTERHYLDTGTADRNRGDMEDFVADELLSKQQREQIAEYAKKKAVTA